ncbi:Hypothetical predicted protein [Marmota monax]|uniref:Methyltransferase domain-containing protein n=1 Tax=Marmota monax TaxID=9995 RepID=A0A5E4D580_MARMO|nr:hypothetical protein GHT09_014399 [Marmota monax]VTJ89364.1 Hypothetical predicted protein [Marmota monax]
MASSRQHWGPEGIGMLSLRENCKLFKIMEIQGKSGLGKSMNRLIKWMQKRKIPLDASVLDIGTGNGVFLVELAKFGFSNITGIDYSPSAIQLSGNIIKKGYLTLT